MNHTTLYFTNVFRHAEPSISDTIEEPILAFDFSADKDRIFFKYKLVLETVSGKRKKILHGYIFQTANLNSISPTSQLTISFFTFLIQDSIRLVNESFEQDIRFDESWLSSQIKSGLLAVLNWTEWRYSSLSTHSLVVTCIWVLRRRICAIWWIVGSNSRPPQSHNLTFEAVRTSGPTASTTNELDCSGQACNILGEGTHNQIAIWCY